MKERPILMNGAMVRATLDGRKTQTRRVVKPQRHPYGNMLNVDEIAREVIGGTCAIRCQYGHPGDRLWVREAWRTYASLDAIPPRDIALGAGIQYEAGGSNVDGCEKLEGMGKYRPPMFMPRWASRILLEIVSVRVERLQDISEEDAKAEGVELNDWYMGDPPPCAPFKHGYSQLWESINGPGSWDANPWVWVIDFRRIKP